MSTVSKTEVTGIIEDYKHLYGKSGSWRTYWQDCANFALPRKEWIETPYKTWGQQMNFNCLYDTRATLALKKSAAGFHSNLTSPASKWFQLETLEEKWMQSGRVQKYFKECDDIQYSVMNNTNFNRAMMEFYTNILCFGVASTFTEQSDRFKVRYSSVPVEQTIIEEDADGYVMAFYRPRRISARKAFMRWGSNISPEMKKAISEGNHYQEFQIIHQVSPRHMRDVSKMDNVSMEFRSVWIVVDENYVLDESGFVENPYAVARWWKDDTGDDPYAYSPVMDCLASIKLVNAQKRSLIRVSMKVSDPALASPYKFWIAPLNLNPAAMNFYDASKFRLDQFQAIKNEGNVPINVDVMKMEQDLIDAHLYVNLFENLMNVTKQMTVPEVQKRIAEALALISPVIGHVLDEGHTPILLRTYSILSRQLVFPPPPKEVQGKDMHITYLSPLAKAQRSSEMNGLNSWTAYITSLIEGGFTDAKYILNVDKIGRRSADLLGVDPECVTEQKEIDQRRKSDQQNQQKMMQLKVQEEASKIAKNLASGHKDVNEGQAAAQQK